MENQALQYVKGMLDKATQKGVYTLAEVANIVSALENLNNSINTDKKD